MVRQPTDAPTPHPGAPKAWTLPARPGASPLLSVDVSRVIGGLGSRDKMALIPRADNVASRKMAARLYQSCATPYCLRIHLACNTKVRSKRCLLVHFRTVRGGRSQILDTYISRRTTYHGIRTPSPNKLRINFRVHAKAPSTQRPRRNSHCNLLISLAGSAHFASWRETAGRSRD
jgi:hypothetical protein